MNMIVFNALRGTYQNEYHGYHKWLISIRVFFAESNHRADNLKRDLLYRTSNLERASGKMCQA